jgi:hypothetical protein
VAEGVPFANGSAWPSYYVDEPVGAPFGSPVHLIYQAVTRTGNLGQPPPDWMLEQAISAEAALRGLTIDAAYAAFEDAVKGSLTPNKLADLVVLSGNPLELPASRINDIQVWMTVIGGRVEWCEPGQQHLCGASEAQSTVDPFVGNWAGTDAADGSPMSLEITRVGDEYSVLYIDEAASICGKDENGRPLYAIEILVQGAAQGDVLQTKSIALQCMADPAVRVERELAIDFTYRAASDTLIDNLDSTVWIRR